MQARILLYFSQKRHRYVKACWNQIVEAFVSFCKRQFGLNLLGRYIRKYVFFGVRILRVRYIILLIVQNLQTLSGTFPRFWSGIESFAAFFGLVKMKYMFLHAWAARSKRMTSSKSSMSTLRLAMLSTHCCLPSRPNPLSSSTRYKQPSATALAGKRLASWYSLHLGYRN